MQFESGHVSHQTVSKQKRNNRHRKQHAEIDAVFFKIGKSKTMTTRFKRQSKRFTFFYFRRIFVRVHDGKCPFPAEHLPAVDFQAAEIGSRNPAVPDRAFQNNFNLSVGGSLRRQFIRTPFGFQAAFNCITAGLFRSCRTAVGRKTEHGHL